MNSPTTTTEFTKCMLGCKVWLRSDHLTTVIQHSHDCVVENTRQCIYKSAPTRAMYKPQKKHKMWQPKNNTTSTDFRDCCILTY